MALARDQFQLFIQDISRRENLEDMIELFASIHQHGFTQSQLFQCFLAAVAKFPLMLRYVPANFCTLELCQWAVATDINVITMVPAHFLEQEKLKEAKTKWQTLLLTNWGKIKITPVHLLTQGLCNAIFKLHPEALPFIPKPFVNYDLYGASKKSRLLDPAAITREGKQLHASDVPAVIDYYQRKFGIRIILNGQTEYAKRVYFEFGQAVLNTIRGLQDDSRNYAVYCISYFNVPKIVWDDMTGAWIYGGKQESSPLHDIAAEMDFSKYMSGDALEELNALLLTFLAGKPELKARLDAEMKRVLQLLPEAARDKCLSKEEALVEIELIQASLNKDEWVGYYFTNDTREKGAHFEVYLVSREAIIQPVSWDVGLDETLVSFGPGNKVVHADICQFATVMQHPSFPKKDKEPLRLPRSQSSKKECAALGMAHLKELQRDEEFQFKNFSLIVPYYLALHDAEDSKIKMEFFFPSPHVLRYAQSTAYIKLFEEMLTDDDDEVVFEHEDKVFTIQTLQSVLNETLAHATEIDDQQTVRQCEEVQEKLPAFREKWLKEFKLSQKKRDAKEVAGMNRNLNFKSFCMFGIAKGLNREMQSADPSLMIAALSQRDSNGLIGLHRLVMYNAGALPQLSERAAAQPELAIAVAIALPAVDTHGVSAMHLIAHECPHVLPNLIENILKINFVEQDVFDSVLAALEAPDMNGKSVWDALQSQDENTHAQDILNSLIACLRSMEAPALERYRDEFSAITKPAPTQRLLTDILLDKCKIILDEKLSRHAAGPY